MWVSYQAERKADERRAKGPPVPAVDPPAETGTGTQEAAAAVQEAGPAVSTQEAAVPSPLQNKRKSPDGMSERRRQKSARRSSTESPEPTGKEVPTHILQQLFGSGGMAHLPAGLSKVLSGVPIGMPGLQAGLGILGGAGDQELGPPGADPYGPWGFDRLDCEMFPALASRRNFWCIQRHQATALHYDLRMQLDGSTFSWAIPKGLVGMKRGEQRRAIETTLHPINYSVYEGSDGQHKGRSKVACGTLLWDVGEYRIDDHKDADSDSDSGNLDSELLARARVNQRAAGRVDGDDGSYEEMKLRHALRGPQRRKGVDSEGNKRLKHRSIHFTLRGGRKLTNHSFVLVHSGVKYKGDGAKINEWFLLLPRGCEGYDWPDEEGEEGEWGRSVKTYRTFKEVCTSEPTPWEQQLGQFGNRGEQGVDIGEGG